MKKIIEHIILFLCIIPVLTNCAAVFVAGVAGTAVVATDPRSSGEVIDDNTLETKLKFKFTKYEKSNIYVDSYSKVVLLTGQVPDQETKDKAEFAVKSTPGVKKLYDYIEIRLPQSFISRTDDSYITTKLRTKLLNIKNLSSNSVKVITTNSVVYLLGIVTPEQGKKIANAAADINGVKKVITLFIYVTSK